MPREIHNNAKFLSFEKYNRTSADRKRLCYLQVIRPSHTELDWLVRNGKMDQFDQFTSDLCIVRQKWIGPGW